MAAMFTCIIVLIVSPFCHGTFTATDYKNCCPPVLVNEDQHEIIGFEGDNVTLNCRSHGHPKPKISWFRNGTLLKGDKSKIRLHRWNVHIEKVGPHDGGEYTCVVENTHGTLRHTVNLNVKTRGVPVIRKNHPSNTSIWEGDDALLECPVTSLSSYSIQWIKQVDVRPPIKNTNVVQDQDNDMSEGKTDAPQDVHVILHHNVDLDGPKEESSIYIEDSGNGNIPTTAVKQRITPTTGSPEDPSKLVLHNVAQSDAGRYSCVVSNARGQNRASAWITVFPKDLRHVKPESDRTDEDVASNLRGIFICVIAVAVLVIIGILSICVVTVKQAVLRSNTNNPRLDS